MNDMTTAARNYERASWQFRAIQRTRGNQTLIGTILLAVLDKSYRLSAKRFGRQAEIAPDGTVYAPYQAADGSLHPQMAVCNIQDMIQSFRRLADALKLSDNERIEMFQKLRQWIVKDARILKDFDPGVPIPEPKNKTVH